MAWRKQHADLFPTQPAILTEHRERFGRGDKKPSISAPPAPFTNLPIEADFLKAFYWLRAANCKCWDKRTPLNQLKILCSQMWKAIVSCIIFSLRVHYSTQSMKPPSLKKTTTPILRWNNTLWTVQMSHKTKGERKIESRTVIFQVKKKFKLMNCLLLNGSALKQKLPQSLVRWPGLPFHQPNFSEERKARNSPFWQVFSSAIA